MTALITNYSIKESKRAKHIGLRVSMHEGLVVTIPEGFNPRKIPEILEKKQQWINHHLKAQAERRKMLAEEAPDRLSKSLPKVINLRAFDEEWRVIYRPTTSKTVNVRADYDHNRLVVYGKINSKTLVLTAIKAWLKELAETMFADWLDDVSSETGLSYTHLTVRNQKSRWGSCTSRKAISLNMKLLFIPREFVQYIMIHELCHTVHMDHSKSFWRLVKRFEPDYLQYDRDMGREAWERFIPLWAE